jgi:hypothetical protein
MFESIERSRFGGKPVRLFVFTRQSLTWRFCSADRDLVVDGHTYLSAQIDRSAIKQTIEPAKDKITITFAYLLDPAAGSYPVTQPLGDNWRPYVPTDDVRVVCLETHYGDADAPAVRWVGVATGIKFGDVEAELTCQPDGALKRALNQGAKWSKACWKQVYSTGLRGCNLPDGAGTQSGTVTRLEQIAGDVDPVAHVVVPELASFLSGLVGKTATWSDGPTHYTATITQAYLAYEWETTVTPFRGVPTTTSGFSWDDGSALHDESAATWSTTYTKRAALVLSDATGLAVDTAIEVQFPSLTTVATLTDVDGLQLTATEFVDATFSLAGGFLTYTAASGLLVRRGIDSHAVGSDVLTLTAGGPGPAIGDAVTALPSCPRTWAACALRGNTINFGGAIYKPIKTPEGTSMAWGIS